MTSRRRRLNFGTYGKSGLTFEEYVVNALTRIEQWSHDVRVTGDDTAAATTNALLQEDGTYLLNQSGSTIGLES